MATPTATAPRVGIGSGPRPLARWRERVFRTTPADAGTVVLQHSRIYILPTRRGWALLACAAMMLLTALNYGLSLAFFVTFALAGLIAAALIQTFRSLAGLEVRPLAAGEAYAGGLIAFSIALAGRGRPRVAIALAPRGAAPVLVDVPADGARSVVLDVAAPHRGRLALGRVVVASSYPLGLWRGWSYVHFPLSGIVYPAPEPGVPALPRGDAGPDAHAGGPGEDVDLAGLREYQRGDPLQRVAWKAVARGHGWYTKQFDGRGGGGPVVLDWAALPRELDVEQRLARLAGWVLVAERAARPFGLRIPGVALPIGQGREQRRAALTELALFAGGAP